MATQIKVWMTVLAVGALASTTALAQNGQAPQRQAPQQGGVQQRTIQQGAIQQRSVQQNITVATGVQTQVTGKVVEGGVALGDIAIRHGKRFDCNHVINQLLRRRHQLHFGGGIIKPAPIVHYGPFGEHVVQPVLSDLELVSVGIVNPGNVDHAPIYGVTIANHGSVDICGFKVSVVAVLGEIDEFSPITTIKIDKICPGTTITAEVQMPFASQAMGNCGHRNPFDTLVVAIDAFDQVVECNEVNNILILQRTAISVIEAKTEVTVTAKVPVAGGNVQAAPAPAPSVPLPDQKTVSPLDRIDLDNLDLSGEGEATGLLSSKGSPF